MVLTKSIISAIIIRLSQEGGSLKRVWRAWKKFKKVFKKVLTSQKNCDIITRSPRARQIESDQKIRKKSDKRLTKSVRCGTIIVPRLKRKNRGGERSLKIEQQMRKYKAQRSQEYLMQSVNMISYNSFKNKSKRVKLRSKTRQIRF